MNWIDVNPFLKANKAARELDAQRTAFFASNPHGQALWEKTEEEQKDRITQDFLVNLTNQTEWLIHTRGLNTDQKFTLAEDFRMITEAMIKGAIKMTLKSESMHKKIQKNEKRPKKTPEQRAEKKTRRENIWSQIQILAIDKQ
jgi:hypothetical protein